MAAVRSTEVVRFSDASDVLEAGKIQLVHALSVSLRLFTSWTWSANDSVGNGCTTF